MKFCSNCGSEISLCIPEGDNRERFVCVCCEAIHYLNPRVIVGTLPVYDDRVLLCRRAIEPRPDYWTLPAGFMENSETTMAGAARETWEEARARARNLELYRVFDIPHISEVHIFYRCSISGGEYGVGPESLETALFKQSDVPWNRIAFSVVEEMLREYFADREDGRFPVRVSTIGRLPY